ncbi:hypothetical protein BH11PLA2_BH11PLA2_25710 [soil metagenome]
MFPRRTFLATAFTSIVGESLRGTAPEDSLNLKARPVTRGPHHHWFGYYDKCPWDKTGRYLLAMENDYCDHQPGVGDKITVGMVDLNDNDKYIPLGTTLAWSWQQGIMLQWLGSSPDRDVIYNDIADGNPVAIIRNVHTSKTRTLPRSIYAVSTDGTQAVTLDFARLHRLRPGYGYASLIETHAKEPAPKDVGIWHMDVASGAGKLIITLDQLAAHQPDDRFKEAVHWVNHLQFNPSGTQLVFLHRWKKPTDKTFATRMYTAKPDGSDLKLLHDSGSISHFDWRDDETVLAWVRLKRNDPRLAFALLDVNGRPPAVVFDTIAQDGHCSYSPDRKWVLNDTYPDKERQQHLMLLDVKTGRRHSLNSFLSPKAFTGPVRCDLHPRWNRDGTQVCFDGCHEPQRQVYVVDVKDVVKS